MLTAGSANVLNAYMDSIQLIDANLYAAATILPPERRLAYIKIETTFLDTVALIRLSVRGE